MKRKLLSLLLSVLLALGCVPAAFAGYENFSGQAVYSGQFADVPSDAWYAPNVRAAYEYGLISGTSPTSFAPARSLTVAETIKLAANLHSVYNTGAPVAGASTPWYQIYVDYALANGILPAPRADYTAPASRAVFASILAAAFPADALTEKNTVEDGAIPDVSTSAWYAAAVYRLYRAGVLTGDNSGAFNPDSTIQRSEAAAIVTRMADPSLRRSITLAGTTVLSASAVMQKCMPAVFKLYAYDESGSLLGAGSGVLIGSDGSAVTCGHIANGVYRLVAELNTGAQYEALMYEVNADLDIAHIRLIGSDFPYLRLADAAKTGDTVYALGYPGGGAAKQTRGFVLDTDCTDYSNTGLGMIQSSARVVSGNSGGALVDRYGRLLGVTVSSQSGGSPSYSVPVSALSRLTAQQAVSVASYSASHAPDASRCYSGLYPVPDFGKITGVSQLALESRGASRYYYYRASSLTQASAMLKRYYAALNENTFYLFAGDQFSSSAGYPYTVRLMEATLGGVEALCVVVTAKSGAGVAALPQDSGALTVAA